MKNTSVVLVVLALFAMDSSLFAHHGTGASYDLHKVIVVQGVITEFNFSNPHSQLYFDVAEADGRVTHWSAEMRNPRNLEQEGHTRKELTTKLAPGVKVEVTGNPSKSGTPVLVLGKVVTTDGWSLAGAGSPAPGAPAGGLPVE